MEIMDIRGSEQTVSTWDKRISYLLDTAGYPQDTEWLIENVIKPFREYGVAAPETLTRFEGMGSEKTDYFKMRWALQRGDLTRISSLTVTCGDHSATLFLHRWRKNHEIEETLYELDLNDPKVVGFVVGLISSNQTV